MMKAVFFVYTLRERNQRDPFYVGKGFGNRPFMHFMVSRLLRDKPLYRKIREIILNDDFPVIEKPYKDLTEEEAIKLESKLIDEYGRIDIGTGCLYNQTVGGGTTKSSLKYIPPTPTDEEKLKKASRIILQGLPMEYNKKQMLRMINHVAALMHSYDEYRAAGLTPDESLEEVYYESVHNMPQYTEKWNSLADERDNERRFQNIGEDSPIVAEIKRIVKAHGWKTIVIGLADYAANQEKLMRACGLEVQANEWNLIHQKFRAVRKRVQL